VSEITHRMRFLCEVGFPTSISTAPCNTLSAERHSAFAWQAVGSGLVGVTYVLDEPSVGLHPRIITVCSNRCCNCATGNTGVVEHDPGTMLMADHVVELGPGLERTAAN
jgi:excinuclease ABC subunit A